MWRVSRCHSSKFRNIPLTWIACVLYLYFANWNGNCSNVFASDPFELPYLAAGKIKLDTNGLKQAVFRQLTNFNALSDFKHYQKYLWLLVKTGHIYHIIIYLVQHETIIVANAIQTPCQITLVASLSGIEPMSSLQSDRGPYLQRNIDILNMVQRRVTELIFG